MKFLGYFFAGLLGLCAWCRSCGVARKFLWIGATRIPGCGAAQGLADSDADGVVRIATSRGDFRARIAGFQDSGERPWWCYCTVFP